MTIVTGQLQLDRIRRAVRGRRIGRGVEYVASTGSTNDDAWDRIDAVDADGLVILSDHQSCGRGRLGRSWISPRGASLLCSIALIDDERRLEGGSLALSAPVAACTAIECCTGVRTTIKWPNDLLVSGRKVGGILVESRRHRRGGRAFVVGIGINCLQQLGHLPDAMKEAATSLELESPRAIDRTELAVAFLRAFDDWVSAIAQDESTSTVCAADGDPLEACRQAWLHRAEPAGQRVTLRQLGRVFTGDMIDIDPSAALVVRLDDGTIRAFDAASTTIGPWMPSLARAGQAARIRER